MSARVYHIAQYYPTAVPVPIGIEEALVKCREVRVKYETNRDIKMMSIWLLLKALTKSGVIKSWRGQMDHLLPWLHISERTLYTQLNRMQAKGLINEDEEGNLVLISYEKAAAIYDVPYCGQRLIPYNYKENATKQSFQYQLRAEEIRAAHDAQLGGLHANLDKNPLLKTELHHALFQAGADMQRLYKEPRYYQERLLQLQMRVFREGSAIIDTVFIRRADINRSVGTWASHHQYKSKQSVSYLKRVMNEMGFISVDKKVVESDNRSRIHYEAEGKRVEGYKWISHQGKTAWFLTDQIEIKYEPINRTKKAGNEAREAA